jgi:hypothetical protein
VAWVRERAIPTELPPRKLGIYRKKSDIVTFWNNFMPSKMNIQRARLRWLHCVLYENIITYGEVYRKGSGLSCSNIQTLVWNVYVQNAGLTHRSWQSCWDTVRAHSEHMPQECLELSTKEIRLRQASKSVPFPTVSSKCNEGLSYLFVVYRVPSSGT